MHKNQDLINVYQQEKDTLPDTILNRIQSLHARQPSFPLHIIYHFYKENPKSFESRFQQMVANKHSEDDESQWISTDKIKIQKKKQSKKKEQQNKKGKEQQEKKGKDQKYDTRNKQKKKDRKFNKNRIQYQQIKQNQTNQPPKSNDQIKKPEIITPSSLAKNVNKQQKITQEIIDNKTQKKTKQDKEPLKPKSVEKKVPARQVGQYFQQDGQYEIFRKGKKLAQQKNRKVLVQYTLSEEGNILQSFLIPIYDQYKLQQ